MDLVVSRRAAHRKKRSSDNRFQMKISKKSGCLTEQRQGEFFYCIYHYLKNIFDKPGILVAMGSKAKMYIIYR